MSFLEVIKKINEEFRITLPENIVHFCDELVEIQTEAIYKTLDSADKHEINHKHAFGALVYGLQQYFDLHEFDSYKKTEEQASWKDRMMGHFMKGE